MAEIEDPVQLIVTLPAKVVEDIDNLLDGDMTREEYVASCAIDEIEGLKMIARGDFL